MLLTSEMFPWRALFCWVFRKPQSFSQLAVLKSFRKIRSGILKSFDFLPLVNENKQAAGLFIRGISTENESYLITHPTLTSLCTCQVKKDVDGDQKMEPHKQGLLNNRLHG